MTDQPKDLTGVELDRFIEARANRQDVEHSLRGMFVDLDRLADSPEGLSRREVESIRHLQQYVRRLLEEVEDGNAHQP